MMTGRQRRLLQRLEECQHGKGAPLDEYDRRIAATCSRNNWVEWIQGGSLRVYRITDEGRKALQAEQDNEKAVMDAKGNE